MTIKEIVYNIQNLLNRGQQSDDNNMSDSQIEFIVNYHRTRILEEEFRRGRRVDSDFFQTINCIKLIRVDLAECCQVELGCPILRTEEALPMFVKLNEVTKLDGTPLSMSNSLRFHWDKYSKFTAKSLKWFERNNYVYVTNNTLLKWIRVTGIFDDPRKVEDMNSCDKDNPCVVDDYEYPMPNKYLSEITTRILKGEMYLYNLYREDKTNDSQDLPRNGQAAE